MLSVSSLIWWIKTVDTFFYENSSSGQRQITEYHQICGIRVQGADDKLMSKE